MPNIKAIADNADIIAKISAFIKENYQEMYIRWSQYSSRGFYEKNND